MQLISLSFGIVGAFCTIFGVWYKMDRDTNAKIDSISRAFSDQLAKAIEIAEEKRARLWERLDIVKKSHKDELKEVQKEMTDAYVPVKFCQLIHSTSDKAMSELKIAIQGLETKVDKLITKFYEKNGRE